MMKYFTVKIFIFFTLSSISQELRYFIPKPDLSTIALEDAINDQDKQKPYRFGIDYAVAIDLSKNRIADHEILKSTFTIHGEGAKSLHFLFDSIYLSKEASLVVKNREGKIMLGPYNHSHNTKVGRFSTGILLDSVAIIELTEPVITQQKSILVLRRITYGYRSLLKSYGLGNSGACNVNTICPEGSGWEDQVRSVAMIVEGGSAGCSGALINNTCQDGKPYFLTANHCLSGDESNWLFLFNWESPDCSLNIDGALNNSISGADVRASAYQSDFALLELFSAPPSLYNPYLAGWDRSGLTPTNETTIHHPAGDVKKISKDFDPVTLSGNYWRINDWDLGTTEGGSSGSPLFNENKQIIGQLFGGLASCSNNSYDEYGRFEISWNFNTPANQKLETWLDGCSTGEQVLEGLDPYNSTLEDIDVACYKLLNVDPKNCTHQLNAQVIIKNTGTDTLQSCIIEYGISGQSGNIAWSGLLPQNQLDTIILPVLSPTILGHDTLTVTLTSPNNLVDQNTLNNTQKKSFYHITDPVPVLFTLQLDDWGSETTWNISTNSLLTLESGGAYRDQNGGILLKDTFCLQRDSCYLFKILDSYGDGISDDGGFYLLPNIDLDTLAYIINENFGYQESQTFCAFDTTTVGTKNTPSLETAFFEIYPNPSYNLLHISFTQKTATKIILRDILGKECETYFVSDLSVILTPNVSSGAYFIQALDSKGALIDQKIWLKQ